MRHIHLHPLGGAAGDMVVACLLDAFPEHREAVVAAAQALAGTSCGLVPHDDGVLTGSRFVVDAPANPEAAGHQHHGHENQGHAHGAHEHQEETHGAPASRHGHRHWSEIRRSLTGSALDPAVRAHAIGIFALLAAAEGRVHGVAPEQVAFHEVGAVDSIADIVAAAAIIAAIEPARWTIASVPLGGGTVRTAHGILPVPAPATALLLEGFTLHDDGITGERVTPTGAAILRYLRGQATTTAVATAGTLRRSGTGFGSRRLPGISNCLRALVFEADTTPAGPGHRELAVISFEVDDQSGEDLALGLDRVRAAPGVHDVVQMPAFGKKSRLAVHVQVLARPDLLEDVVALCFQETTTIGLRTHLVQGRALPRRFASSDVAGRSVTTKLVERPDGVVTGKTEADHLREVPGHAARTAIRRQAEAHATSSGADRSLSPTAPELTAGKAGLCPDPPKA